MPALYPHYPTLILSHTHTITHSYYHTLVLSHTRTITHSYYHTLVLSHTHTITHSYYHTLVLSHTHTITHSYYHTLILSTHSYYHTLVLSHTQYTCKDHISDLSSHILFSNSELQENIFHGQALGLWTLKMDKPKKKTYKIPHIKVLLVNKHRLDKSVII